MMKKSMVSLLLALALLLGAACADELKLAARPADLSPLERYAAWTEEGAAWRVYSNETVAALNQLAAEAGGSAGYFYLAISGDRAEGIVQPELVFCYLGPRTLNADTASLVLDQARFDFKTTHETMLIGRVTVEVMRAPLDAAGVKALRRLYVARQVRVRLLGDYSYAFEPALRDVYATTRQQIEASSLKGVSAMLAELDALGVAQYGLWDLNAARWERLYGFRPQMEACALGREAADAAIPLKNDFEMLAREDSGQAVRRLQELLMETGYMQGRPDGSFGDGTDRAVRAARRYWGMMECGIADRALIDALEGKAAAEKADTSGTGALAPLGGVCDVSLSRCWFAGAFASEKGDVRAAVNGDDLLFIAEGRVLNTSAEELTFYRQLSAALSLGEVSFPCTLVCETDAGARFDTALLPLGEARLVIYAEVPARAAAADGWTLALSAGGETLTYTVTGGN
ncbi:MAG: peptidoglycan-binding protein [Clostridia bacterium]|nr:peptidoglycan-binding protein [Clostridia bacterium]